MILLILYNSFATSELLINFAKTPKKNYGYKVELSNKYNLKFTRQGKFIGKNH